MKKILLIAAVCILAACGEDKKPQQDKGLLSTDLVSNPVSAEGTSETDINKMPTMDFADSVHNFGTIQEGEVVTHDFIFKNNGKSPLLISSATGSCGCTVPDYPRDPIQPGKEGVIKVKFNSDGKPNHQDKTVIIYSNSKRGMYELHIKADVTPRQ